ncbi:HEAT repeat domain-containing protein [Allorhizocola rhizosphaerae]|uniref:HEAT repeat domain-containing protein n=1 Tax=Allorhizocola rhizosphaerae TaxID=1872709 RepID=UPI000E3E3366|nr:HEAT repeat domain-containing protein [Allorhizocola rhizosphaerae]
MSLPRHRVIEASAKHGEATVAGWCVDVLQGARNEQTFEILCGPHWAGLINSGAYWGRVWGARGLLYAWSPTAAPAVLSGLDDPAWRVREMCGKVVRLRELPDAADRLFELALHDEVPRVRVAAERALARVGEAEHADALRSNETALRELSRRLDRSL